MMNRAVPVPIGAQVGIPLPVPQLHPNQQEQIELALEGNYSCLKNISLLKIKRPCGLMDKASDFGSGDCRFESCLGQFIFIVFVNKVCGTQNE
jgi:hypothetical protein